MLQPLETIISSSRCLPPNDEMRDLLALPASIGGIGGIALTNPTPVAEVEFFASTKVSDPLKDAIL